MPGLRASIDASARRLAPGRKLTESVHPIIFIIVEALLIGFFVFGYILYRRRRSRPPGNG